MGCARSGSTLLLQWLASSGLFSYPSNLIARFYKNPYIGLRVQQALLEFDPLNQMAFANTSIDFSSKLGKTIGALSPSEYWYFWRTFFDFSDDTQLIPEKELAKVKGKEFLEKLAAFELLTAKPLAMKGMLLNWHIPYLYQLNKKFLFVNLERDSFSNAQSRLFAREQYFNDRSKWYSFKPIEYATLKEKDPVTQVAGQVTFTKRTVREGLAEIPEGNVINITYSEFCANPGDFLNRVVDKMNRLGANLNLEEVSSEMFKSFEAKNTVRLTNEEVKLLNQKIKEFEKDSY
jgi:hypothetical protein